MKTNITELVFILDKSGSMSGLESDTISGYNTMLSKQQKEPSKAIITTVLFDDNYELLHDRINIKGIRPIIVAVALHCWMLSERPFIRLATHNSITSKDQRADKVVLVITTDGMENASREYTAAITVRCF